MSLLDYFRTGTLNGTNGTVRGGGVTPRAEQRSIFPDSYSVSDPSLAEFLGLAGSSAAGIAVTEQSALGFTAVYRAVSIIAGTIASLPLKTYRTMPDDTRTRVPSFMDDPGGPDGLTQYEWVELVMIHLLLHGNAYLFHVYNGGGGLMALQPLHPFAVAVKKDTGVPGGRYYTVTLADGSQRDYTALELTHVMGPSLDGFLGLSPISVARNAIGTGLAGDDAAARMFSNGFLLGGLVSVEESLPESEAQAIKEKLKTKMAGTRNAADVAMVNAALKFSPWSMDAESAQFIASRQFQVEEVARLFGVPKSLIAQDGASTWGSGIAELIRGMQKFTLMPWTNRLEARLSRLLARPRFVEFDYNGLLQPTPSEVIANMKTEIEIGILTIDEARRLLNRPPLPTGATVPTVGPPIGA